jgi:hypothetical protein
MAKTMEDIEQIRQSAAELDNLGVPPKITDKIRRWANEEEDRLRNEARDKS